MYGDRKKVEFPKWVNRPWRFVGVEYDEVAWGGGAGLSLFLLFGFMGLDILFVIFGGLGGAYAFLEGYRYYKNEKGAAAVYYLLYKRGFLNPKESSMEFMDCEYIDRKVIPTGYELEFSN